MGRHFDIIENTSAFNVVKICISLLASSSSFVSYRPTRPGAATAGVQRFVRPTGSYTVCPYDARNVAVVITCGTAPWPLDTRNMA